MSIHTDNISIQPLHDGSGSGNTRKRTRDEVEATTIDKRPFTIKAGLHLDPSDPFARPRAFTPIRLLARAQLPLAYLDTVQSGSRLFSANVQILESIHNHGGAATVLVAQETKERRLYAVGRVKYRTYALCRLGDWVKEDDLWEQSGCLISAEAPRLEKRAKVRTKSGQPWWSGAVVDVAQNPEQRASAGGIVPALAMRRVIEASQKISTRTVDSTKQLPAPSLEPPQSDPTEEIDSQKTFQQSPEEVLKELTKQYLEALYLSRTSLAYFTKGPLSRARAAFSTQNPDMHISDLLDFLRGSILTSTTMDKKYREGIEDVIKAIPVTPDGNHESTSKVERRKKKRKWKRRREKGGFFVDERESVELWWRNESAVVVDGDLAAEPSEQRLTSKLRNRETFLQIILILETLALEASTGPEFAEKVRAPPGATGSQKAETQLVGSHTPSEAKTSKSKKADLPALLETLLDKLTIWHSLESTSPAKLRTINATHEHDPLQSFCIEVVVPFYVSRIPHYANIVNKKLGGPSAPTPVKRKTSTALQRKPGEPAVRKPPEKKARHPLARVSTDTLNHGLPRKRTVPSLHRSSADSEALLPHIKRERSESVPSLDTIPPAKTQRRSRESLISQISGFGRREVDLSAMSQATEAKLKKKAEVEEKLKEAISTLRKPDRDRAVREVQARADREFENAVAKGNKQQQRVGFGTQAGGAVDMLHVTATPSKHVRTVKSTPGHRPHASGSTNHIPSSGGSTHITSCSERPHASQIRAGFPTGTPAAIPATSHRSRYRQASEQLPRGGSGGVEETPSRGFARFMPVGLVPGKTRTLDSTTASPSRSRTGDGVLRTPSKSVKRFFEPQGPLVEDEKEYGTPRLMTRKGKGIDSTPRPPPRALAIEEALGDLVDERPDLCAAGREKAKAEASVYKDLGWEDEDEGYEELG